ncbi:C25 family cysteine peptidase [Candidatus Cloacimonadota bacterium]
MKARIIFLILIIVSFQLWSNAKIDLSRYTTSTNILENSEARLSLQYNISEINSFNMETEMGTFAHLDINGYTYTTEQGAPKLPVLRKIISVPFGAEVEVNISDFVTSEFDLSSEGILFDIIPAQPSLSKSADPEEIEFVYNADSYNVSSYDTEEIVSIEELGIMRSERLFLVTYKPVKYNPANNSIMVYNNVNVTLEFNGGSELISNYMKEKTNSPYFTGLFQKTIFNYRTNTGRDVLTQYPVKYLIISDRMFEDQLQPFIEWKIRKGFEVIIAYTDEIGTTTTAIKDYIQEQYDAGTPTDPAPSFLLFVGDDEQIPAYNGSTGGHVTDLNYAKLDGSDIYPEIYYSRFSAQTTAQLQPQIDKTLMYEKYEMPDPSYLGEVVMIAGMDSYWAPTHANGQINYGTDYYFNEDHGIESHTYLYPESGSNSANIVSNVSDGVGYVNYTAHGSSTSWSDPSFTINNINSLQNDGEYPLVVGNCCLTNKFEIDTCFGEAWLRAEDKGAIGYIGGTNSTYWDEDFWWGVGAGTPVSNPSYEATGPGVYDGLFHDYGDETFEDWFVTATAIIYAGNMAVVEGGGSVNYYWEIYSLMGDPSLTAYMGVPAQNTVSNSGLIFLGLNTFDISADPYSYVSLTRDNEIIATALVDETGSATLEFTPFTTPGDAELVITAQNKQPYFEYVQVIPNDGPYLVINNYIPQAGDDDYIEAGESVTLTVSLGNVGTVDANNVQITAICSDEYITLTNNFADFGTCPAYQTTTLEAALAFDVSDITPDLHEFEFTLLITADGYDWEGLMEFTAFEANVFSVNPEYFELEMAPNEMLTDIFSLSNLSERVVEYTIRTQDQFNGRDLTDSYVVCSTDEFTPGETVDWFFTVYNQSPDNEWMTDVTIEFPAGVTINSATNFAGGSGGELIYDETTGEAVSVNWHGETALGYGLIHGGQAATAMVNITTTTEFAGNIELNYEIIGDGYGADPHVITGTMGLDYPLSWISLASSSGTLNGSETHEIEVIFNTEEMLEGYYECELFISDVETRDYKRVPVNLHVVDTDAPETEIPNGNIHLGNYPNPFNPTTTISFSVDKNINEAILEIYNIRGQMINSFTIDTSDHRSIYNVVWNGESSKGDNVSSGIYFSKIKSGKFTSTKKMILMK